MGQPPKRAQIDTLSWSISGSHKIDLQYPLSFVNPSFLGILYSLYWGDVKSCERTAFALVSATGQLRRSRESAEKLEEVR